MPEDPPRVSKEHATEPRRTPIPTTVPPPPEGAPPAVAAMEARVRVRMQLGYPLSREEKRFFARMPADDGIPPDAIRGPSNVSEQDDR